MEMATLQVISTRRPNPLPLRPPLISILLATPQNRHKHARRYTISQLVGVSFLRNSVQLLFTWLKRATNNYLSLQPVKCNQYENNFLEAGNLVEMYKKSEA
jgi:hypothetical protein